MMRAFLVLAGLALTSVGLIVTFSTGIVNGWAMVAVVGVVLLGIDLYIEQREADDASR